ncbi:MAG: ATP-binding cassette domain-containing protein [Desulfotomaculum sp.]|nr:ATP-binding cassette domain-containing protein [Desulfotomaculum sp.]MCL0081425.1 ATP-binding cassette domain-containing protein [Peptococcaceae bacterium]
MEKTLTVHEISKTFGATTVVNKVSFDVQAGTILGILGHNGAGKTTTIRMIIGVLQPDAGYVAFNFNNHKKEFNANQIGYLPEERGLYKDVKVMDVLLYLAHLKNYPLAKARHRALDYLAKFDLEGQDKVKVSELSKGMAQKVQFIAAVIHQPKLLVLDEPFSGLDPVSQDIFKAEVRALAQQGTAILLSSHQMNIVEALCDRVFMIHQGKKVIYGEMLAIKAQFAGFKCQISGNNCDIDFNMLAGVDSVTTAGTGTATAITLHLKKDINPQQFIQQLPAQVQINELHLDRISLHDIFVKIAKGELPHEKQL